MQCNATVRNLKPSWGQNLLVLPTGSQPKYVDTTMALEYSWIILNGRKKKKKDKMTSICVSFTFTHEKFYLKELW